MKRVTCIFLIFLLGITEWMPAPTFATGDIRLSKKAASGPDTPMPLTPVNSSLVGFDGSGNFTTVLQSAYQASDGDLTALGALTGTNTIYYRSASNTWTAVTIGGNLSFSSGTLSGAGLVANTFTGAQSITDATAATSSTTGALKVTGGISSQLDSNFHGVRVGLGAGSVATNLVVGASFPNITSGNINTAIGFNALDGLTSGISNTAVGTSALQAMTSGQGNTAVGGDSLISSTTGFTNTAVGARALGAVGAGADSNVGIGYQAGRFQNDGSTALALTTDNNVYLGTNARGSSNTETGAIVIGDTALGQGSNKIVIGKAATTANYIFGAPSGGGNLGVRLTSNYTTTLATNVDTALSFAIGANETWIVDVAMNVVSPAAGSKFQITAPTGATVEGSVCSTPLTGSASSPIGFRFSAINTLNASSATTLNVTTCTTIRVVIINGATPGTVAIGAASVTATQTTTINSGASLKAQLVQ